jgi:hypothetical protein
LGCEPVIIAIGTDDLRATSGLIQAQLPYLELFRPQPAVLVRRYDINKPVSAAISSQLLYAICVGDATCERVPEVVFCAGAMSIMIIGGCPGWGGGLCFHFDFALFGHLRLWGWLKKYLWYAYNFADAQKKHIAYLHALDIFNFLLRYRLFAIRIIDRNKVGQGYGSFAFDGKPDEIVTVHFWNIERLKKGPAGTGPGWLFD